MFIYVLAPLFGFFCMASVFVLSFFSAVLLASSAFFPLVLGLSIAGAVCVGAPVCIKLVRDTGPKDKNRKQYGLAIAVAGVSMLMLLSMWGGFVAGMLTGHLVFFMISFGVLCVCMLGGIIVDLVRYKSDVRRLCLRIMGCVVCSAAYVSLGLHLIGVLVLPPVWLWIVNMAVLGNIALTWVLVMSRVAEESEINLCKLGDGIAFLGAISNAGGLLGSALENIIIRMENKQILTRSSLDGNRST